MSGQNTLQRFLYVNKKIFRLVEKCIWQNTHWKLFVILAESRGQTILHVRKNKLQKIIHASKKHSANNS